MTAGSAHQESLNASRASGLVVMIPTLLLALEQHGRSRLGQADHDRVLAISAATM
jgi:hypothetical protein